jgi:hypothetical protein
MDTRTHTTNEDRRSGGFNLFKFNSIAEIIYEPELNKVKDLTAYYESFEEIVIKRGGLILSVSIADLPKEEKTALKSLMNAIADLSTGNYKE